MTMQSVNASMESIEKPGLGHDLSTLGGGRPLPPYCPELEDFVVTFDEGDPSHPQNWTTWNKVYISTIACAGTFVASFNSAIFAAGAANAAHTFGVGKEVAILGTSLFVLGFASGPLIWAPGSELIGRRWPLFLGMFGSSIFTIGAAVSKDIQTLIICRFFAGVFGASPLCVVPGVLSDMFNNMYRGMAITIYALTVFGGPFLAPFIGAFITESYLGWRWTQYLAAIIGFANAALLLFTTSETSAPMILVEKAAYLRHQTGNWAIHAAQERVELDFRALLTKHFTRPLRMLMTEPVVFLVSAYMSFIYGLVYALLQAYPYVFGQVYGMGVGVRDLPFLGLFIGVVLAMAFLLCQHPAYIKKLAANNGQVVPEWRLGPVILGAVIFPVGLFWFAWTGFTESIHWMAPTAAGILIGFGVLCIFLPCFNYLVDAFLPIAASTVAANIMLRSTVASAFPLFSTQMFENLGVQWAGTLLACLATLMIPIPLVFRAYGGRLRSKSRILNSLAVEAKL